jgi:hypothetical protein
MNRLQTATSENLWDLGQAIRSGKQSPLTADEYAWLLNVLKSPQSTLQTRKSLLILALLDHGSNNALLDYCNTLLVKTLEKRIFSGYEAGSNIALQIVLAKSPDKDYWARQFEQSSAAVLRLAVAEHIAGTDLQRGLMMMIETIPLAGTDHTVSDSIDLWLANKTSAHLLSTVEAKLAELQHTQPKSALTAAYRHARDIVANP